MSRKRRATGTVLAVVGVLITLVILAVVVSRPGWVICPAASVDGCSCCGC